MRRAFAFTAILTIGLVAAAQGSDLDRGFAQDGLIRDQFRTVDGESHPSVATGVAVDPGKRVVVSGAIVSSEVEQTDADGDLAVARYIATGQPDLGFGEDGVAVVDVPWDQRSAGFTPGTAVDTRGNGAVVVAAEAPPLPGQSAHNRRGIFVAQLTPSGELDRRFGDDGMTLVMVDDLNFIHDLETDADGRVLLAGYTSPSGGRERRSGFVVRLTPDGRFDPAFSGSGVWVLNREGDSVFDDVDAVGGDQVLLAGSLRSQRDELRGEAPVVLVRLRANGHPKKRFAKRGVRIDRARPFKGPAHATAVGRHRIVAAAGGKAIFLSAFTERGRRDRNFAGNGRKREKIKNRAIVHGVETKKRRIVVGGGSRSQGTERFLVARFKRNGRTDRAFSGNGRALADSRRPAGSKHRVEALTVDNVGRPVLAGTNQRIDDGTGERLFAAYTVARFRAR